MSPIVPPNTDENVDPAPPELAWAAHPARERLGPAVATAVAILAFGSAAGVFMQHAGWAIFAVVVLLLALNRFFLPSRFVIDADGITARYPFGRQRFRWADLRRVATDGRSAYLGTRARRSWLDAYRGVHVLFGRQREAVMERINAHLGARTAPRDGDGSWAH